MPDIPTTEPSSIVAGDYVQWKRSLSDYPAGTWTLTYALVKSGQLIEITAAQSGTDHLVSLAKVTTAAYTPGIYSWQAYVTSGDERYTVDQGTMEIERNLAAESSGYDDRTHVKTVLDALEARIEGRATKDQAEMVVGGEVLAMMPMHRVLEWYEKYKAWYQQEIQAEAVANGEGHAGNVYVRFADP